MKFLLSTLLFLSFACFAVAFTSHVAQIKAAMSFGNGVYTNVCGTGLNASDHTCDQGCDPTKGTCQNSAATVVKFTCDGKQSECRSNETAFSTSQSFDGTTCGKTVQIDVFSKNCRANGGWDCADRDIKDYLVWYSGDCVSPAQSTCDAQGTTAIMFRKAGTSKWIDGSSLTASGLRAGEEFEVNCFAKSGTGLLENARIDLTSPEGKTSQVSQTAELRKYRSFQSGTHVFRCVSKTVANCSQSDKVVIKNAQVANQPTTPVQPTPATPAIGGPQVVVQSSSQPVAKPTHKSSCDKLTIVSGNHGTVPTTVKFKASGSDSLGSLQKYKYYFGDGTIIESDSAEVEHRYEVSGNFKARVDLKDSKGNWITSASCESQVTVKALPVESHKAACSDVEITIDNAGQAPATARFKINGFDNKGSIQQYRLDFGNGVIKDSDSQNFEQTYTVAGTYTVKAFIKNSRGEWQGGENHCRENIYITTKPITKQPETGTPTIMSMLGLMSGTVGVGLQYYQRKRKH
jgi:PKD repeat protein